MKNVFSVAFCLLMIAAIINGYSQTRKEKKHAAKLEQIENNKQMIEKLLTVDSSFYFAVKSGGQSASVPYSGAQSSNGYFFQLENGKIECYLPYYGVMRTASLTGGGIDFTSDKYSYEVAQRRGASGWVVTVKAKDQNNATYDMNFTVSTTGNSSLTINPSGRQVVTFTGVIENNK